MYFSGFVNPDKPTGSRDLMRAITAITAMSKVTKLDGNSTQDKIGRKKLCVSNNPTQEASGRGMSDHNNCDN